MVENSNTETHLAGCVFIIVFFFFFLAFCCKLEFVFSKSFTASRAAANTAPTAAYRGCTAVTYVPLSFKKNLH